MARPKSRIQLPVSVLADRALTPTDIVVLAAISLLSDANTGTCSAKRKSISAAAGVPETSVSRSTSRLLKAGWLEKAAGGWRSQSVTYSIRWEKGNEIAPFPSPERVTKSHPFPAKKGNEIAQPPEKGNEIAPFSGEPTLDPRARTRSSNNLYIYTDPDRIGSDLKADVSNSTKQVGIDEFVTALTNHGMPASWVRKDDTKNIIRSWRDAGITIDALNQACLHALKHKRYGPIGPKYVDMVLQSLRQQGEKRGHADDFGTGRRLSVAEQGTEARRRFEERLAREQGERDITGDIERVG